MKTPVKIITKLLRQVVFACLYWGFYAAGYHLCSKLESEDLYILRVECIIVPIVAIFVYIMGVINLIGDIDLLGSFYQPRSNKKLVDQIVEIFVQLVLLWFYMILWPFCENLAPLLAIIFIPMSLAYTAYIFSFFVYDILFKHR